jgi:hypothetical protein
MAEDQQTTSGKNSDSDVAAAISDEIDNHSTNLTIC